MRDGDAQGKEQRKREPGIARDVAWKCPPVELGLERGGGIFLQEELANQRDDRQVSLMSPLRGSATLRHLPSAFALGQICAALPALTCRESELIRRRWRSGGRRR